MSLVVKHSRIKSFSCASLLCESLKESAASKSWRKEPLVTPSLYGAVLRKGLKSRFGAPTLLPQWDSCNLLSNTPILQLLQSLPMAYQTRCWIKGGRKQLAGGETDTHLKVPPGLLTTENCWSQPAGRTKWDPGRPWFWPHSCYCTWTARLWVSSALWCVEMFAFGFLSCFPPYQLFKTSLHFLRVIMISDNQRRRQLYLLQGMKKKRGKSAIFSCLKFNSLSKEWCLQSFTFLYFCSFRTSWLYWNHLPSFSLSVRKDSMASPLKIFFVRFF